MTKQSQFTRRALLACGAFAGLPAFAQSQDWPAKTVKVIIPSAPASSPDRLTRLIAERLSKQWGQPVVVENRPGASTRIGAGEVAKAAPDGYTLLLTSPGNAINVTLFKQMPYDVRTELTQVAIVGRAPGIVLVRPDFPANNVKDLVAIAKKEPGKLNFGSGGPGSSEHLGGEMFKMNAGIDMTHVPYKGGASVINDILSGQVQVFFTNQSNVIGQIKGKLVKVLGVASSQRSALLPDVPTFAEQGYPEQQLSVWWGIAAPAKTPPAILDRLNREIVAAGSSPSMRTRLTEMGAESLTTTRQQANAFVEEEIVRWAKVVKSSNAQVD